MKKYLIAVSLIFSLQSCVIHYPKAGQVDAFSKNQLQGVQKDTYVLLDNVRYSQDSFRLRIGFLGFGGTKTFEEAYRREATYNAALKRNGIDGIVNPQFKTTYFKMPFLLFPLFGIANYTTVVEGRAYKMK